MALKFPSRRVADPAAQLNFEWLEQHGGAGGGTPGPAGPAGPAGGAGPAGPAGADGLPRHIQDEGVALTDRATMDFQGAGVVATDDAPNGKTVVTVAGIPPSLPWHVLGAAGEPALVAAGWANYDTPRFLKDPMGFVHFAGEINQPVANATTRNPNTLLWTMPVGYRPAKRCYLPVSSNPGNNDFSLWILVLPNGEVRISDNHGAWPTYIALMAMTPYLAES